MAIIVHQPTEPSAFEISSIARNTVNGSSSGPPIERGRNICRRPAAARASTTCDGTRRIRSPSSREATTSDESLCAAVTTSAYRSGPSSPESTFTSLFLNGPPLRGKRYRRSASRSPLSRNAHWPGYVTCRLVDRHTGLRQRLRGRNQEFATRLAAGGEWIRTISTAVTKGSLGCCRTEMPGR